MGNFKNLNELLNQRYPAEEYIVDGLIPADSITILSGQSRSYKTYTLLEIALSVAEGKPLFGNFNTKQTGVLIIDEENGERLLQKRLCQLGADDAGLPVYISSFGGFRLDDMHIKEVLDFCENKGIEFVIVDALIRVHSADENSARDMSRVFNQLRSFTKAGIAVLVTQHNRKAGNNYGGGANEMRGSSDILAAVDSHVGVVRQDKQYLTFTQEKQRYDEELDPFQVKVNATKTTFQFEYLGLFRKPIDKPKVLLAATHELLEGRGSMNAGELLNALNEDGTTQTNENSLRPLLKRWVAEGNLPEPTRGKGNEKIYTTWENKNEPAN